MRTTVTFRSRPTSVVLRHRKVANGMVPICGALMTKALAGGLPTFRAVQVRDINEVFATVT